MYDELVKRIRRQAVYLPEKFGKNAELLDALMKAADAIEELSRLHEAQRQNIIALMNEEPEPKWIPCSERLPENGEYVLCFCRANIVCVLRRDKDGDWYENPAHVYMSGFVTHWMPLPPSPEPPKEET